MPGVDDFHKKHPKVNEGLLSSAPERPSETAPAAKPGRAGSAQLTRLAHRTRQDAEDLASRIDPDTVRRTKYPVIEQVTEDGKRTFTHDPGIETGVRTLTSGSGLTSREPQ